MYVPLLSLNLNDFYFYSSIEMEEFEHATCLKHVLLRSQETVSGLKGYFAIGTIYGFGEETVSKGRVSVH